MNSSVKNTADWALAAAILCSFITGVSLRATTVLYVPFEGQCSAARIIVLATAAGRSSSWDSGHSLIFTDTRFQVEETLKGPVLSTVTTRIPGGQIGDIAQEIAGAPEFTTGRRYVLFLEQRQDGFYRVAGFHQGCYPVLSGKDGKERVAPRLAAAGAEPHLLGAGAAEAAAGEQALSEFLARIRNYLKQSGR